jgi:hypothetical protein
MASARDAKRQPGPVLVFLTTERDAFIGGVRDGEFDLPRPPASCSTRTVTYEALCAADQRAPLMEIPATARRARRQGTPIQLRSWRIGG